MAKHDWNALQAQFIKAHAETGIAAKDWCEANGLNYSSARRYIKTSAAKKKKRQQEAPVIPRNQPVVRKGSIGNQRARKHGAYSGYFNKNITDLVDSTQLEDELELCRSRIHLVVATMEEIQRRIKEEQPPIDVAASLYDSLFKAENALDRNVTRVESITKTLSSLQLDSVQYEKIIADTEKNRASAELIRLNVDKIRKEAGGASKLDQYIDELTGGDVDQVVG